MLFFKVFFGAFYAFIYNIRGERDVEGHATKVPSCTRTRTLGYMVGATNPVLLFYKKKKLSQCLPSWTFPKVRTNGPCHNSINAQSLNYVFTGKPPCLSCHSPLSSIK